MHPLCRTFEKHRKAAMAPNPISPIVVGMGAQLIPISRSPAAPFCIWLRSVSAKEHVELIVKTVHTTPCILFSMLPVIFHFADLCPISRWHFVHRSLAVSDDSTIHFLFSACCPISRGHLLCEMQTAQTRKCKMMVCCGVRTAIVNTSANDRHGCCAGPSNVNRHRLHKQSAYA